MGDGFGRSERIASLLLAGPLLLSCAAGPRPVHSTAAAPPPSFPRAAVIEDLGAAPDFVLLDVVGDAPFALAERRGRWCVLHFFPRADTPDCACDATVFTEHLWRFGSLDVEVACVTAAPEADARRYAHKYGLVAPLLVDPDLAVARDYGAFDPNRADPVIRTSVIVGPEGRVRARFDDVVGNSHVDELLAALDALGASGVSASKGE